MSQTATATMTATKTVVRARRRESGMIQAMQALLGDLAELPPYEQVPEIYSDWGEEGEFKVEVGRGECAQ